MNKSKFLLPIFISILPACQPPRSPVIKRPLEIQGKASEKANISPKDKVQIGIRVEVSETTMGSDGAIQAFDLISNKKETWPPGRYKFSVEEGGLLFEGESKGKKWRLKSDDADKFLQCGNNSFRGDLIVRAVDSDKLTVVNELSIDDYLKGVLPREVVVTWPDQSLRVQAVASRTYLASHLGSHAPQGFDLCSDVHCQAYGGMTKEHPKTNEAVDSTSGEILVSGGKPIGAFFHSNCGGTTETIDHVWGRDTKSYLPRKKCSYGLADPRYNWKISLADDDILGPLRNKTKVKGNKLKSVRVKKKSPSGRAERISVTTEQGTFDLSGNEFRIALNPERIRSTLFTGLARHGGAYEFSGRGWGHGVGMCQWGAKGQAEHGKDFREILDFYYPNTELKVWSR